MRINEDQTDINPRGGGARQPDLEEGLKPDHSTLATDTVRAIQRDFGRRLPQRRLTLVNNDGEITRLRGRSRRPERLPLGPRP